MNQTLNRFSLPVVGLMVSTAAAVTFGMMAGGDAFGASTGASDDTPFAGLEAAMVATGAEELEVPQAGLNSSAAVPATSTGAWMRALAQMRYGEEFAEKFDPEGTGSAFAGETPLTPTSPILSEHPRLGPVAAPVLRFRDGGHAYYLFGKGLHSCTYVGKCMDLFAPIGEPVYAMAAGEVKIPDYAGGSYGNYLIIKFNDGSKAIYAHLHEIFIKPGPVAAGQVIGSVGCSGTSGESNRCRNSEQHLHLEWSGLKWKPGQYGQLPPAFNQWRGDPMRCYKGCGPAKD
jgi:murein DD-endopeptidase MepM/ murein hydrolase activator NlpD